MTTKSKIEAAFETYSLSGDGSLLSFILRSELPLTTDDRDFLADLWDGKIKLPPGKPRFSAAFALSGEIFDASKLGRAAKKVDLLKAEMGRSARTHGASAAAVKKVALEEGVQEDQLAARMRLPLRNRYL